MGACDAYTVSSRRGVPCQNFRQSKSVVGIILCRAKFLSRHMDLWCSQECTPACQAGGRGFKSRRARHENPVRTDGVSQQVYRDRCTSGQIAQLVERTPEKREVVGSIPTLTTRSASRSTSRRTRRSTNRSTSENAIGQAPQCAGISTRPNTLPPR